MNCMSLKETCIIVLILFSVMVVNAVSCTMIFPICQFCEMPQVMQCDQATSQLSMLNIICPVVLDCHGFQAIEERVIIQAVHFFRVLLQNIIKQNTSIFKKCGEINILLKQQELKCKFYKVHSSETAIRHSTFHSTEE